MEPIAGIFPAAMTMFDREGKLDEPGCRRHLNFLLRNGVHGLVIAGSSGEFIALDDEERRRVLAIAADEVRGGPYRHMPLYAGSGYYSTRQTVQLTQYAETLGYDGAIVILPYYQKPPKPAVIQHFRTLRAETRLPIMLYNNPGYAGCAELTPRDVLAMVEEGLVQSVKSTFESVTPVHDLLYLCGDRLRVFYGSFMSALEGLLAGAHGWVSGVLNLLPAQAVQLYQAACIDKDVDAARAAWNVMLPFVHLYTHQELGPANDLAIYRAALEMMGEHGGHSRAPFYPLTEVQRAIVRQRLEAAGMLR